MSEKRAGTRRLGAVMAAGTAVLGLASCASGTASVAGAGASSQEIAMQAWMAGFYEQNPDVLVSYDPTGSGAGREMFINGAVQFAGSDAALDDAELDAATERCSGGDVIELPLYISPIAVAYNLPDLDVPHVNLTPEVIAAIFNGEVERWDDPAIAATNPGVALPDLAVVPVNRSDDSGTTENFTEYLAAAGGDAWPHEPSGTWPRSGTQSGAQNAGVVSTLEGAAGTIAYVDASQVTEALGTVAVGVGDEFVPFSPEAAATVVDVSPPAEGATDLRLTIDLAHDTDEAGAYPVVLVSYTIACSRYDEEQAEGIAALLTYIASEEGQALAARPDVAGSAPISQDLRERVMAAVGQISAATDAG
ncbi:phosphate ABC transporter substrate-binding protein PstS [Georgenia wangjunii]|uniref:phosphate ABC transporter substrate-binding protein PstS n=1 Tax=Georgenia wangjunii TaxID=3117730 RepID=UPI002F264831